MKLLGFNKVLCLSPHPDDVEYSISGTIMKYSDTKFELFFMTNGTQADTTSNNNRFSESRAFWNELKLKNISLDFNMSSNNFDTLKESQWIAFIENRFKMDDYDAILTSSDKDSHFEHLITNRIAVALTRNKSLSLIEYKSPSTLNEWIPNMFIELTGVNYQQKTLGLRQTFNSQMDSPYFKDSVIKAFHSDYLSRKRGTGLTEQFKIKQLYGL